MTLEGIQGRRSLQAGVYLNSLSVEGHLHLKQAALIALGTSLLVLGSPAGAHEEGEQAGWGEMSLNNINFFAIFDLRKNI